MHFFICKNCFKLIANRYDTKFKKNRIYYINEKNLANKIKYSNQSLNNTDISSIIENITWSKQEKYCFRGYYIQNINDYLKLNNDEKLIEKIQEFLINVPTFSISFNNSFRKNHPLKRAIRSIQNQSFKFYKILLVNNKS